MKVSEKLGTYILSDHARERIRQRLGITAETAAISWVKRAVQNSSSTKIDGNKTHYFTDVFEIILDGAKVVTVKPKESANPYLTKFKSVIEKEANKLRTKYERELRKAEIEVAQITLNLLRAKNPKTKASIERKLTEAVDYKALIEDELKAISKASERYGI